MGTVSYAVFDLNDLEIALMRQFRLERANAGAHPSLKAKVGARMCIGEHQSPNLAAQVWGTHHTAHNDECQS